MSQKLGFMAIQLHPDYNLNSHGDDGEVIGTLRPVAADGFYRTQKLASEAAQFMAEEKAHCPTYVVQVVRIIRE